MNAAEIKIVLAACFGSFLVELFFAYDCSMQGKFPDRYKSISFWVIRVLIVIASGWLANIYEVPSAKLAVQFGAVTPIVFKQLLDAAKTTTKRGRKSP